MGNIGQAEILDLSQPRSNNLITNNVVLVGPALARLSALLPLDKEPIGLLAFGVFKGEIFQGQNFITHREAGDVLAVGFGADIGGAVNLPLLVDRRTRVTGPSNLIQFPSITKKDQ